tara:strand:- start:20146 stop:21303 length:1158 start_codon:yes stop_codon:yes gene_type:complete
MIRLGFAIHLNNTWLGGINVILNLINTIESDEKLGKNIKIILFTNSKKKLKKFNINKKVEIIECFELFSQSIFIKLIDKLFLFFFGKTIFLEKFLKKHNINFISHTTFVTGKKSYTKSLVWIPDFQYLYFPNFFSLKYKVLKKINIFLYKIHSYKILLSSKSAFKDLKKITNIKNNKVLVNQFTFDIPNINYLKNFSYLKKKYNLKKNFFYLPNQYWVHKNHRVVIEAQKRLLDQGKKNIYIYSSGSKEDYRHPQNFDNLFKLVKKYKMQNNYFHLGLIPFIDVMSLIYNSLAVINPSLFEGWSSTVEQAKGYNKKVILSNISVHKEQNPKNGYFFNPYDSKELSQILFKINFKLYKKRSFPNKKKIDTKKINYNYTKNFLQLIK